MNVNFVFGINDCHLIFPLQFAHGFLRHKERGIGEVKFYSNAPEHWGSDIAIVLLKEAKRLSPKGLDLLVNKDNFRAIRFYEKYGFTYAGEDKNPVSGIAVNRMAWRP